MTLKKLVIVGWGGWVLLLSSPTVLAWVDLGHEILCEIAFQELSPPARKTVKRLMQDVLSSERSPNRVPGLIILVSGCVSIL